MSIKSYAIAACLTLAASIPASAATIITTGAGSAVTTADRTATFDSLTTTGVSLLNYQESDLQISVNDTTFAGFDPFDGQGGGANSGFHYGTGGNTSFVTITSTTGSIFSGLEFLLGNGNGGASTNVVWQTLLDGVETGAGAFNTLKGVAGWSDALGFDTLRVGAFAGTYTAFGQFQAIALDDLSVQFSNSVPAVPLPAGLPLMLAAFGAFGFVRRSKRA